MTTQKKIKANRDNARNSTGPLSPEGKAVVARNAYKHGLCAQESLLWYENAKQLRSLAIGLYEQLQPVGQMEEFLVDRIAAAAWRLTRVHEIEVGLLGRPDHKGQRASVGESFRIDARSDNFSRLARYETSIERSMLRSLHELERLQARRTGGEAAGPITLDVTAESNDDASLAE